MSSDVQQCEPVPETQSPQKRKSLDHQDVDEPEPKKTTSHLYTKLKHSIITSQYSHLNKLSTQIELALLEKYFLDNRLVYSDYPKWLEVHSKTPRNKILRDYLLSHFNPTELTALSDKCSAQLDLKLAVSTPTAASSSAEQFKSMAECAKHEAQVLQRISELRKQGLWSIKRLPKLVEPARAKTHWDYLLDEMVWMSTDFVQERKWKVNTCRKISAAVHKHFREREARWETAERDEQKRVRKQAAAVAREVQQFWKQVAKLIEYKQRSISEEKRKIQMDQQLNFIVDQTEKYSSWLVQSLNQSKERSDDEVCRLGEVSDNESTIESDEDRPVDDELAQLTQESQLDLNVLLKDYNLDESYFCQNFAKEQDDESSESDENEDEEIVSDDMSEEEDDEETIEQDEKMDNEYDAQKELDELKADFELPIEQLLEKLKKPNDENQEASSSTDQNDGLDSIAAHAESFQPTGYTLETTNVKTRIPSELLKHNLREYQHVGLDWLVTMYENKLNGILADEMGLGKTIQTIALLAHLAVDKAVWGPHLIVVPTSVMLNWELEFKKWSPGFKILTYYGSQKERKLKRIGWTKTNAFHVCITSYKLVIQDHAIFRRKKWKYFILDEAQNIKNFKSQRWQTLLNFQSQRRLLLTGTPLQNNLMELWSLMHFLMPHVFASHRQFNQWFNNPFKTMIEKSTEVNEQLIKRLHKVLRPFILRRLKAHVEKQMPKKYEHVIKCALSKRQRLLYDEFMSLSSTREKIAQGHYMSVINILMQLRKVCNHPDLFEPRPIVSSFVSQPIEYQVPSMVFNLSDELFAVNQLSHYHPGIADIETMSAFDSHRAKRLQLSSKHIEQCLAQTHAKPRDHVTWANFFQDKSLVGIRSSSVHSSCPQQHTSADLTDHSIKANYLSRLNKLRFIFHKPVYGRDLIEYVNNIRVSQCDSKSFATRSYATCEMSRASGDYLEYTNALRQIVNWLRDYLMHEMESVCEKFVMYVPHVRYSSSDYVTMRIANPHAAQYRKYTSIKQPIKNVCVHTGFARLNQIVNTLTSTQFPDKRLIQYDCGKLQKLDSLLRQLFSGEHRVLLFTQMTRMLDVLENFLNYHGYKYLRLDGATSIEQRQVLMERFNTDKRIFCFILSTRSGGVGVNLTGADTVVFYDSDWNPTMDAQAQDRCHRIGQTRDVHIYRLISEKTVEENILKKADQKRLLSQMAIEGGCFTTAVLRKSHITELFEEEEHQQPVIEENNESSVGQIDDTKFEEALGMVEDESDVNAAKNLRQEVQADIAEFDENENLTDDADMVKLHTEFKFIETELKPIERYALKYLESTGEVQIENDAEPDIEQVKKSWELERLKRLKEEEERKAEQEEEDLMYTYTKTEIWINDHSDQMPLWCPLTPPSNDRDVYIDTYDASNYLYDSEPIAEELLPPVTYSKRGDKRLKIDLISPSKQKQQNLQNIQSQTSSQQLSAQSNQSIVKSSIKSLENIIIPRPLFDKTNTTLIKLRRDVKMQKLKGWPTFKMDIVKSTLPIQPEFSGKDDWLPNDDFNIIYALQVVLELPLNLQPIAPSHQVNWDLVSDMVSSGFTKQYRSPQECRKRFENVILKREELCLTEIQNKKQQMLQAEQSATKIKTANKPVVLNITKTKTLRTNQLFLQDNFKQLVQNQNRRFDKITSIGKKRHQSQFSIFSVQQPSQFTAYSLQQPLGPAQQLNHQNLLSRFNSSLPQTPIVSSFVTNATNALITAIKQTHTQTSSINADSIHFRTPKYFSDMKILKEKQAKQASLVVTSPVASQVPASPSQTQTIKQTQTASPSPSAHKNQTILSHLQQQQRATSALAAQLAASAAAVAQQSIEKPKQQQTSPMTPNQPQTVQQHLQKPQSISAIIQNQQNQTIFYQNQQAQSQSSLRSLVQSTSPATQTINQQQQQQQQQQPQITIAVPISSSGSGSQTISSIINNQQLHQSSGQQAIRFYPNQSNKNSSLNELRKKTTVAGITAAAAAAASSVQPPQSPSQVTTQTKQLIQQQKINKQMQQQMSVQKPASQSPVVVAQQQSSGQQNVPAVQRSSPATSILIRQNPQSNMPKATIQQTIQQIQQQQQQQGVQAVKQEEPAAKQNTTSNAQNQAGVQANQQTPQVITVQSANSSTNVNTVQNIVSRQQSSTGQPSTITTLIKPINNVSLSNQQKQGIIMTNQPQFRQFQLMSNSSSQNSQNGQVVIQQPNIVMNTNTGQPQTTIRKVGSSTNISTLQQKVQVINRGNIQIVQANSGQRLTKTTPLNTTSVSSSTSNSTPIQFQQAFQQQTAKQSAPNSNQTTSVSTLTSGATMPTLKTSITPAQKSSSTPTTVKTLLASSNQASNFSIISTSAGVNTSGIPQAIPINSSLSQVLRQLGNQNNLSINIQSLNSINASPIQLIQATSSNSGTNVSDSNENSNNSEPTLAVGSNNNSNLTSSQNENKQ